MRQPFAKRVVLVGAGHAHLHALAQADRFTRAGIELVLIAPDDFWYSGLATGMVGGLYPPALDRIDAGALIRRGGGRFIRDRVVRIDPRARMVVPADAPPIGYDALSVNLGSTASGRLPGAAEHAYAVKPIRNLMRLRQDLEFRMRAAVPPGPVRVVIAGGGPTAVELAGNIARLAADRGGAAAITVLATASRLLPSLPPPAGAAAARSLTGRGVDIRCGIPVGRIDEGHAILADGTAVPFDVCVDATGLVPAPLIRTIGLPTDAAGALLVDDRLRSVADALVHGGGDCVALAGRELARVGVYAVRQAPILTDNLLAAVTGGSPRRFTPQQRYLLILNLGDGTGLAVRGGWHWHGRAAFLLKDVIDRRFLGRYRR